MQTSGHHFEFVSNGIYDIEVRRCSAIEYNKTYWSWHFEKNGNYGPVDHPQNHI